MLCYFVIAVIMIIIIQDINRSMQERCNSIANALELCLSCTNPSKSSMRYPHHAIYYPCRPCSSLSLPQPDSYHIFLHHWLWPAIDPCHKVFICSNNTKAYKIPITLSITFPLKNMIMSTFLQMSWELRYCGMCKMTWLDHQSRNYSNANFHKI